MRFPSIRLGPRLARRQLPTRNMSSRPEFVAVALKSDPALFGSNDKDKEAITQLESETKNMSADLPVCFVLRFSIRALIDSTHNRR